MNVVCDRFSGIFWGGSGWYRGGFWGRIGGECTSVHNAEQVFHSNWQASEESTPPRKPVVQKPAIKPSPAKTITKPPPKSTTPEKSQTPAKQKTPVESLPIKSPSKKEKSPKKPPKKEAKKEAKPTQVDAMTSMTPREAINVQENSKKTEQDGRNAKVMWCGVSLLLTWCQADTPRKLKTPRSKTPRKFEEISRKIPEAFVSDISSSDTDYSTDSSDYL